MPRLAVQPGVRHVIYPNTDARPRNAMVGNAMVAQMLSHTGTVGGRVARRLSLVGQPRSCKPYRSS